MQLLTPADRDAALGGLPRWRYDALRRAIVTNYVFADFAAAWVLMTRVALLAERRDHHPQWSNVWNKVEVAMTTHDAGGVTARDVEFAAAIDAWATESLGR